MDIQSSQFQGGSTRTSFSDMNVKTMCASVRVWQRMVVMMAEGKKQRKENENDAHLPKQTPVLQTHLWSI